MPVKATERARRGLAAGAVALLWSSATLAAGPTKDECVDANEDAQDLRQAGALLAARTRLGVCIAVQCPGPVRDDCVARLQAVEEAIPTIVVDDQGGGGSAPGRAITVDGHSIARSTASAPIAVDPGVHHIAFEPDGHGAESVTVVVQEGEKDHRVVIPAVSPSPTGVQRLQRPLGLGVGALGLAGVALGGILAALAKSTDAHALSDECGGDPGACSPTGVRDGERAHAQARASTIAFVGGGVLLGAGAVIYFTAPGAHGVAFGAAGGADHASLTLGGNF
jgi:hypothetical protein